MAYCLWTPWDSVWAVFNLSFKQEHSYKYYCVETYVLQTDIFTDFFVGNILYKFMTAAVTDHFVNVMISVRKSFKNPGQQLREMCENL